MVLRFLIRYLANNEELVRRLSESYPMRRAARLVVYIINRGKLLAEERGLHDKLAPEELKKYVRRFSNNLKEEIEKAKSKYEKK
ncbi:protein NCBP2AS2 homolog [Onthophagus taurus]|uniref:protein NCBP2AS2 homolog n=1 Tax=Onthophagus taurus TaxID=166361 RepID=UPI0039BE9E72